MNHLRGLSIVVPTYNEAENVTKLARRIVQIMAESNIPYEIIFIDDHSTDSTRRKIGSLSQAYPIITQVKKGKNGKGFSIYQGFTLAKFEHIAMLDADLQYPPEILPELYQKAIATGFAVANRKTYKSSRVRTFASRANALILGKLFLGLHTDIQSGLKVFHRDVFERLDTKLISAWAIDIPLVHTAYNLGYTPSHIDIDFHPRNSGESKVDLIKTSWEIVKGAIRTKLYHKKVHTYESTAVNTMLGSGFAYKRKRFTTHTALSHNKSALVTMVPWQRAVLAVFVSILALGIFINPLQTAIICVAFLSTIYFIDVIFNLFVVLKSLHFPPEIQIGDSEVDALKDADLPVYTVLCPLYREAKVLPQFVEAMKRIEWPKEKLEVLLLLEQDDQHTIDAARAMHLPKFIKVVIVPDSEPKTKPKASNYGLAVAKGEYVVVYDAEDKPDPNQLKKAYLAFTKQSAKVVCLQAKLNYYNPHHNLLTRLFTAEYSLWFDVILPGLQSINTTIPLGGTSNHFRTAKLIELLGWDPFNVTEDCDLGARLFASGYKTAIIDSTTLEEANSNGKNWFRQRSRWIKGYIQTYLVQMRNPLQFMRDHGWHALIFQLIVGMRISFMLINPILWAITISYFTLYWLVGPTIESLYPTVVFYMAVSSLVFGNFIYLYNYMIGCAKRGHWSLVKYTFFVPLYWLMMSAGAVIAVYQLIFKPHYWEKTIHGLHLLHEEAQKEKALLRLAASTSRASRLQRLADLVQSKQILGGGLLIASSMIGNVMNFLYNAYLGRKVSLEDFGVVSLIGSILYIAHVPMGALGRTVTHRSAYLFGQFDTPIKSFWKATRHKAYYWALGISVVWLAITPLLMNFFHTDSIVPFILFTPVWIIGTLSSVDGGFLGGNLKFTTIALISLVESTSKLLFSLLFVEAGLTHFVYAAVPLSMALAFLVGWYLANRIKSDPQKSNISDKLFYLPKKFYFTSILTSLSSITFLSMDLLMAKHYLSASDAGSYSFLTLAGKMVYFLSGLFSQFTLPLVSRDQGSGKQTKVFIKIFSLIIGVNILGVLFFGIFGYITVPILWGAKAIEIVPYLPIYSIAMACFAMSGAIITYHQAKHQYAFAIAGFAFSLLQIVGMFLFHDSIASLTAVVTATAFITLAGIIVLNQFYPQIISIYKNTLDLLGLFSRLPTPVVPQTGKLRILIFNWRDMRHKWSGGAEVYIHELAKRWVAMGHKVTVFCGNDQKSSRYETLDGVWIIRRGGFYTVYIWAFLYYLRHLRGKYDIIIDSENGLPFFTPIYAKEKIYLLIHHVHQEVFRKSLRPPFSWLAQFLERRFMPIVYRNTEVLTVSPSSKAAILEHHLTKKDPRVIYNGVDLTVCKPGSKSQNPTVLYLGRLTSAKSISVLIASVQKVRSWVPKAQFIIAGDGPEKDKLVKMVRSLKLESCVTFMGKVSDAVKINLLQRAWVFVNPSLIEGWGITTIEANACGTPVVASNVAGLRDAVHNPHSGLLVPYGSVDEFAVSIIKILKETKTRQRMNQESIEWAKKFDWDRSAQESIELFLS